MICKRYNKDICISVCRSMSNDLYVLDSPRSVIRTYSNYNRRRTDEQSSPSSTRRGEGDTDNLRVVAINNNITKKEREGQVMKMFTVSIHNPSKQERWQNWIRFVIFVLPWCHLSFIYLFGYFISEIYLKVFTYNFQIEPELMINLCHHSTGHIKWTHYHLVHTE